MADIDVRYITEALNRKVDLPDNKGQDGIDYVVEWKKPTSSDPTWYRVYKSGWVEQGGIELNVTAYNTYVTKNLIKPMKDLIYCIFGNVRAGGSSSVQYNVLQFEPVNRTQYKVKTGCQEAITYAWHVSGQGE